MWKAAAVVGVGSVGAWMSWVRSERNKIPQGRRRQFAPGSADEVMLDRIKAGDLVVFSRDCTLYYPCGALACSMTKRFGGGSKYDHCGVVVVSHEGYMYLVEEGFDGEVKVRPFDERIVCSRAFEIIIRPLAHDLGAAQERELWEAVQVAKKEGGDAGLRWLRYGPKKATVSLLSRLYHAAGVDVGDSLSEFVGRDTKGIWGEEFWMRDRRE